MELDNTFHAKKGKLFINKTFKLISAFIGRNFINKFWKSWVISCWYCRKTPCTVLHDPCEKGHEVVNILPVILKLEQIKSAHMWHKEMLSVILFIKNLLNVFHLWYQVLLKSSVFESSHVWVSARNRRCSEF